MAVKTITITENAYRVLKARKRGKESFSDVIIRMYGKEALLKFCGAISRESGEKLERAIKEARRKRDDADRIRRLKIEKELGG